VISGDTDGYERPQTRPLKIYAIDPMLGRAAGRELSIAVENERLSPGPQGERLEVVDYDGAHKRFYPPLNLDSPDVLMRGGMEPSESDPRFHQQMVYAVAMRTLENFDRALGRRLNLSRGKNSPRLRLFPHAFYGANAFYDRKLHAVLFGYFRADPNDPGRNIPNQTIFTCLSHDIIAHEVTHAIVDRLRPYFLEPSNEDVPAFHEGFSDIVALFQKFSFRDLVSEQLQQSHTDIRSRSSLVELATQFGYATGAGRPLRTAIDNPDPRAYQTQFEPHTRGSILVSAVFDAFFGTYERRTRDLIRIASGGTGRLPDGDLLPDLVGRVATEASKTAQQLLSMCIRAFDYLPPVDITFGDYLRALVTADYELSPNDEWGTRAALIEAFRVRGVYASQVASLAEESLLWEDASPDFPPIEDIDSTVLLREFVTAATRVSRERPRRTETYVSGRKSKYDEDPDVPDSPPVDAAQLIATGSTSDSPSPQRQIAQELHRYAESYRRQLSLRDDLPIEVAGFHTSFRVAPSGQLLIEFIVQFAQTQRLDDDALGGLPLRGGTTVVAAANGTVRYVISKPLPHSALDPAAKAAATARIERQKRYVQVCDASDLSEAYGLGGNPRERMLRRMNLRSLHEGF
jgi:hypothetical protein